jgi:hypothetical protein
MDNRKRASSISGGIFLIGLGVLFLTDWWWPGILVVIGLSGGGELIFRGQIIKGLGTIAFFCGIPLIWTIVQATNISWGIVGPFILIALGVILLVKVFFLKDDEEQPEFEDSVE